MSKPLFATLSDAYQQGLGIARRALGGTVQNSTFDGKRKMYDVLGYQQRPHIAEYFNRYARQDIAKRIVDAMPNAIWSRPPTIMQDDDADNETKFELAFQEFAQTHKLWHVLARLDKLARQGRYAILVIGAGDGKKLNEPMEPLKKITDIKYLHPYSELNAWVQSYYEETNSCMFGKPKTYSVQTGGLYDESRNNSSTGQGRMPSKSLTVHHSRVIHLAEDTQENEVFGIPVLQPVLNLLDDLMKVVGGGSETWWLNSRGALAYSAQDSEADFEPEAVKAGAAEFDHQLSRNVFVKGIDVKPIEFKIDKPAEHVAAILDLMSSATAIPKRILIGSERGELASSQDKDHWMQQIDARRRTFIEPMLLRPLIQLLIDSGALPKVDSFDIEWPDLFTPSRKEISEAAASTANAIATFTNSIGGRELLTPKQFVEDVLDMNYLEEDINAAMAEEEAAMAEEQQMLEDQAAADKMGEVVGLDGKKIKSPVKKPPIPAVKGAAK